MKRQPLAPFSHSLHGELITKILRRAVDKGLGSFLLFESCFDRCSTAEQKLNIPEGVLKKEVKTAEQKAKDLEEDIRKKQEMLDKMQVSSLFCVYFLLFFLAVFVPVLKYFYTLRNDL